MQINVEDARRIINICKEEDKKILESVEECIRLNRPVFENWKKKNQKAI